MEFSLLELSADGLICPEGEPRKLQHGGLWERLWKHKWTPSIHRFRMAGPSYSAALPGSTKSCKPCQTLKPRPANYASIVAELRTLRAFYNSDWLWTTSEYPDRRQQQCQSGRNQTPIRVEVFNYVEKLRIISPPRTTGVSTATYGRATRWFGYAVLAKIYLKSPDIYRPAQPVGPGLRGCM